MKKDFIHDQQYLYNLGGSPTWVLGTSHVSIERHSHDFYELVFVREGYCMHHLEDSAFLVLEGDLLVIKPGVRHRYTGNRECKIYNCLFAAEAFDPSVLESLLSLPGLPQILDKETEPFPHLHLDMIEKRNLSNLLSLMSKECETMADGWKLKLQALLYEVLIECSRIYTAHGGRQSEKDIYSGHVTTVLRYIDEHYAKDTLTVRELGEQAGISPDYLSRQFRKMTGIAVQEYVRRYRLSRAINCLQQGCSVGETAEKCGFHSIGYFSREFKKEMGIAPSRYELRQ